MSVYKREKKKSLNMPDLNKRLGIKAHNPLSSVHQPGDEDKTVSLKVRKSKVTP